MALLGAVAAPAAAHAQTAEISLPGLAKDRGLRSGEWTLHPSVTVQGHHDTNFFNGTDVENNTPVGVTSLRILPRLTLANDPNADFALNFAGALDARMYLTDNAAVDAQKQVGGTAGLDLTMGKRRTLSLSVFDHFGRHLRANNWETVEALNRVSNDVGGRVEFHPGDVPERRPFNVAFMGSYAIDRFDDFKAGDTDMIRTRMTGSWKFLPKTAAILDASWDFRSYARNTLTSAGIASDSQPFRGKAGLAGALTRRISLELLGGWGLSNHEQGDSVSTFLANVGIGIRPSDTTRILLTYSHDFRDSFYGNYVDIHQGGVQLRQRFGNILDVAGYFNAAYGLFGPVDRAQIDKLLGPGTPVTPNIKQRHDIFLDAGLSAQFEVARLVGMDIGYKLRSDITDYEIRGASNEVLDAGEYTAHEIFASVTLRY